MHFPTRLYYAGDRRAVVDYFASMPEFARRNGYAYVLLTPSDFGGDLSYEERVEVRNRIDLNAPSAEFDGNSVSVRRIIPEGVQ
jgi:hypothetical protein